MEISSFPFPTPEDYPSNFFSFFQDFDFTTDNTTATAFASEPLPKKRKTDDFDFDSIVEEGSLRTVENILSKFLGFDNEEEKINTNFDFSSHQPTQPIANQSVFEFSNQQMMNKNFKLVIVL